MPEVVLMPPALASDEQLLIMVCHPNLDGTEHYNNMLQAISGTLNIHIDLELIFF